jgi:tetratricopeptide (TPR) repeat protein
VTERDVAGALREAETLRDLARQQQDDPAKWEAALTMARSAVRRAEGLLDRGSVREEVHAWVNASRDALERENADRRLSALLEDVRLEAEELQGGRRQGDRTARRYVEAFRDYGFDVLALDTADVGRRLRSHPLRERLLAALEHWQREAPSPADRRRLDQALQAADPDPRSFRNRRRAARGDRAALQALAKERGVESLPATEVEALAYDLALVGDWEGAADVLRVGQGRFPSDFWLNHDLGHVLYHKQPRRLDEAIGYYRGALALRPRSVRVRVSLGGALIFKGDLGEAVRCLREAVRLDPRYAGGHHNLGTALQFQGDLPGAVASYREAIRQQPTYVAAYRNLGVALRVQGDLAGSADVLREAVRLDPRDALAHLDLGITLRAQKDLAGSADALREAVRLDPGNARAHVFLANTLVERKDPAGAIDSLREAICLDPEDAVAQYNLGNVFHAQRNLPRAAASFREAIRLNPNNPSYHNNLGVTLRSRGDRVGAGAAFREAVRLNPNYALGHFGLGFTLLEQKQYRDALPALKRAQELFPPTDFRQPRIRDAIRQAEGALTDGESVERPMPGDL